MKAIILAAGKGSRLRPLTNTTPKPLIKIFGKTILEHNLKYIYKKVDEIIIVVNYKKEEFFKKIGYKFKGTKITYHIQGSEKGTGAAIRGLDIEDDVILLNGDSIFDKNDLNKIIDLKGYGCLVKEVESPEKYGIFKKSKKGLAEQIIEKPKENIGNLANLGVYKFSKDIFSLVNLIKLSIRGEYEITDAINNFCIQYPFELISIKGNFIDIGVCPDILTANNYFLKKLEESKIKGIIEEGVTIKGNIVLSKGSVIKSGTYIEGNIYIGKDSVVGPNTYLRGGTVIGNNCRIGNAVELKNTTIGDNTNVAHLSYLGDSIVGKNVNIAGGFISANIRHDKSIIKIMVKGKLVSTNKEKFGVIIGDNVKTGINTCSMPGRIIENDTLTMPNEIIN